MGQRERGLRSCFYDYGVWRGCEHALKLYIGNDSMDILKTADLGNLKGVILTYVTYNLLKLLKK